MLRSCRAVKRRDPRQHRTGFRPRLVCTVATMCLSSFVYAQRGPTGPPEDVETITGEASRTPEKPLSTIDRPIYRSLQQWKKALNDRFGINWAVEDTLIYQATSGGVEPNDAMVNTLGLFA